MQGYADVFADDAACTLGPAQLWAGFLWLASPWLLPEWPCTVLMERGGLGELWAYVGSWQLRSVILGPPVVPHLRSLRSTTLAGIFTSRLVSSGGMAGGTPMILVILHPVIEDCEIMRMISSDRLPRVLDCGPLRMVAAGL